MDAQHYEASFANLSTSLAFRIIILLRKFRAKIEYLVITRIEIYDDCAHEMIRFHDELIR
jgi:hypothetical protein